MVQLLGDFSNLQVELFNLIEGFAEARGRLTAREYDICVGQ
jgi:hypothetical protein